MIPKATQDRVITALPDAFQLPYEADGTPHTGEFDMRRRWADEGSEPDQSVYHLLVCSLGPTGVVRETDGLSLGPTEIREGTATTIEELYATPVYDELTVTAVTKGHHEPTGTTAKERMGHLQPALARYLQYEFRQELGDDTLVDGPADVPVQIPVNGVGGAEDVSGLVADEDVARYATTIQIDYQLSYLKELDTVAGLDIDLKASQVAEPARIEVRFDDQ